MKIFIGGFSCTGKTTVGDYLRDEYGYQHFDFESGAGKGNHLWEFVVRTSEFVNNLKGNVVITWMFPLSPVGVLWIRYLRSRGFKIIILDGDKPTLFKIWLKKWKKKGYTEKDFYINMLRHLERQETLKSTAEELVGATVVNVFKNGEFRKLEDIAKEILK